jgi:hypothetical protein
MAEQVKDNNVQQDWEDRACQTFSAERKEDLVVLFLAGITVILVWTGLVGPQFFKSLFF